MSDSPSGFGRGRISLELFILNLAGRGFAFKRDKGTSNVCNTLASPDAINFPDIQREKKKPREQNFSLKETRILSPGHS